MIENAERKKWQRPQLIQLGTISSIEENNQISKKMQQELIALREALHAGAAQEETGKKP